MVALNAGIGSGLGPTDPLDLAAYRRIVGVNQDAVVYGLDAAVPHLRGTGGRAVVTASLAGLVPMPADPLYTLTKTAVVGYVRAVAPALAEQGVTVTALCPGFADTAILGSMRDELVAALPLLSADDVGDAFLALLDGGQAGRGLVRAAGPGAGAVRLPRRAGTALVKAWQVRRLGPPAEAMELVEVPDPVAGPGELLVRVEACALNFPDVLLAAGQYQEQPGAAVHPGPRGLRHGGRGRPAGDRRAAAAPRRAGRAGRAARARGVRRAGRDARGRGRRAAHHVPDRVRGAAPPGRRCGRGSGCWCTPAPAASARPRSRSGWPRARGWWRPPAARRRSRSAGSSARTR